MTVLRFTVLGRPQPAGSKRALPVRQGGVATGQIAVIDANPRVKSWQQEVRVAARQEAVEQDVDALLDGPLGLRVRFHRARPKSHYRTGGNAHLLRDGVPAYPASRPDTTKLLRGLEDAMTGVVYADDAQVVVQDARKLYGTPERVDVEVWTL